jgi:cytoskeletal protein CcmA (bactofilin family)
MASVETALVNSIVGAGTYFKGTISVSGLLRIDGDFSGGVKSSGRVIIGRGGRADCTIDAATVVIGGVFRGTVYASDKVIALDTAIIIGNIYSPRIIAESGVILDGAMHVRGVEVKATASADDTILSDTGQNTTGRRRRNRKMSTAASEPQRMP